MEEELHEYSFLPIRRPDLHKFYNQQRDVFWVPAEINYADDKLDFDKLDGHTKRFIKFILAFFAQADGIINENLMERFQSDTRMYKEASHFYIIQAAMELIHNETYSLLVQAIIEDESERKKVLKGIENFPAVGEIANWMFRWMSVKSGGDAVDPTRLRERVIAFTCIEGIIFSSAFASIYWIKKRNILHGLTKANEFIARDEKIHTEFGVELYHQICRDRNSTLDFETIKRVISSAVELTEKFTRDALKVDLVGMNADDMVKYVKCTADHLSYSLCNRKIYDVENPFPWMIMIGMSNKSNFFETTPTEYAKEEESTKFTLEEDF